MDDVFGRPMDLTLSREKTNRNPIAPNPISGGAQSDEFGGARGFGSEGTGGSDSSAFHTGKVESETLGAAHRIRASKPGPVDTNVNWGSSGPGGYMLPACIKRDDSLD